MTAFAVDLEMLTELVERMTACGARLEEVQAEVDNRVRRAHATWQGEAAERNRHAHQRWVAGSRQMHEALTVLRSIATTAGENYSSATRANQQMWAR